MNTFRKIRISIFPKLAGLLLVLLISGSWLNVAFGQEATIRAFTVNTIFDSFDHKKGDGVCADIGGNCSLRAALEESNALPTFPQLIINLPAGTYNLTLGQLVIHNSLSLRGAGANNTIIDGQKQSRVFLISNPGGGGANPAVHIFDVTIQNGKGPTLSNEREGAGIRQHPISFGQYRSAK